MINKFYTKTGGDAYSHVGAIQQLPEITIAERDALTPQEGWVARVQTIGLQVYRDSAWRTLTDHEVGTWTPVLDFSGASVGITYTTQVGNYIRIGSLVNVNCEIFLSNKGSSTGDSNISLPFQVANISRPGSNLVTFSNNLSAITHPNISVYANSNESKALLGTSSGSNLTDTSFTNTTQIIFNLNYRIA